MEHSIGELVEMLGLFGGIALVILAGNKAKIDKMRAERQMWQQSAAPQDSTVLAELRTLKQQVGEMQDTSHQFDISFDAALGRLEERVSRVETKAAVASTAPSQTEEVQQIGLR